MTFQEQMFATFLGSVFGFIFAIVIFYTQESYKEKKEQKNIFSNLREEIWFNISVVEQWTNLLKGAIERSQNLSENQEFDLKVYKILDTYSLSKSTYNMLMEKGKIRALGVDNLKLLSNCHSMEELIKQYIKDVEEKQMKTVRHQNKDLLNQHYKWALSQNEKIINIQRRVMQAINNRYLARKESEILISQGFPVVKFYS